MKNNSIYKSNLPLTLLSEDGSSIIETCAHLPYISMTAYSLDGKPVAAVPWSMPFT